MIIAPLIGNVQPLRINNEKQSLNFKMNPVEVPTAVKTEVQELLINIQKALDDCDTGLLLDSTRKAARKKVPGDVISAAVEQVQTGENLLIFG